MDWFIIAAIWLMLAGIAVPVIILYDQRYSVRARIRNRARAATGFGPQRNIASTSGGAQGEIANARARQKLIQGKLKELENRRARNKRNALRQLLLQADASIGVLGYAMICVVVGVIGTLALSLFGQSLAVAAAGGAGCGIVLPRVYLKSAIKKRQKAFTSNFADALDILVRGTRTGLPVGECLRIVGRELPDPVGYEFRLLVESQRIGITMEQAMERALERMPTAELQFFSIVLLIQQQTGGNLATTLENLSHVLRSRKQLRDKVSSLSSEAKSSAMIIGSLPFVFGTLVWLINPHFIELLFVTRLGNIMLFGGLFWMGCGIMVMRSMIDFKL